MSFEKYRLDIPSLIQKPSDIPAEYIAYNPSAIWTTEDKHGNPHDIMYVRIEPDSANSKESHLGKTLARPYEIDVKDFSKPLKPYYEAEEIRGEDPALTRINRRLANGAIESVWLLSAVDANPYPFKPNEIKSLRTRFYVGTSLNILEHVADGPEDMKDIRIAPYSPDSTKLHVYGRPRVGEYNGNITHAIISSIENLDAEAILSAQYINEKMFSADKEMWGGVNDAISVKPGKLILATHRAWKIKEEFSKTALHYEAVLYGHNTNKNSVINLGVLATSGDFPNGKIKDNENIDLHDVVFTGGGYNGGLDYMTFGVRDGSIGIGKLKKR
jgi:hypothetical protein